MWASLCCCCRGGYIQKRSVLVRAVHIMKTLNIKDIKRRYEERKTRRKYLLLPGEEKSLGLLYDRACNRTCCLRLACLEFGAALNLSAPWGNDSRSEEKNNNNARKICSEV